MTNVKYPVFMAMKVQTCDCAGAKETSLKEDYTLLCVCITVYISQISKNCYNLTNLFDSCFPYHKHLSVAVFSPLRVNSLSHYKQLFTGDSPASGTFSP